MKLSTYAIIVAILAFIYGVAMLIFPVQFGHNYGVTLDPNSTVITREFGAAMFAFAIIYWINRNAPESDRSWSALLWSGVFFNVAIVIVVLMATMDGLGNSMNWSSIILSAILTLCSLYFIFRKRLAS
jgi:hypothetical protein